MGGVRSLVNRETVRGTNLSFTEDALCLSLEDGRVLFVPIVWFPKLAEANKAQLNNWRWIGNGLGIHWSDLDEDISVAGLLK